jgi:acyl-coenzyme A thioesterase PaaI-like protein
MMTTSSDHAKRRLLAEQIRALAEATLLTRAGDDDLTEALALLREATGRLDGSMRSSRYEGIPGLAPGAETNAAIWETHAVFGPSNSLAPPLNIVEHPGRLEATITFGASYEGGPGLVYGGFIAAAFDGMLGRAVLRSGHLGVTRSLTVRYLRPTPLRTPLRLEASVLPAQGRNIDVTGRLWAADTLTCEAEAVFTSVDETRYQI